MMRHLIKLSRRRPPTQWGPSGRRRSGWMCGLVLAGLFLTMAGANRARGEALAELTRVPSDGFAVLSVRVADLWNHKLAQEMRRKMPGEVGDLSRQMEKSLGVGPGQIERFTFLVLPIRGTNPLMIVTTTRPYSKKKVLARLGKTYETKKAGGKTFYQGPRRQAVCLLNDRTLVLGQASDVQTLLERKLPETPGGLTPALKALARKHVLVFGISPRTIMEVAGNPPPQVEPFLPLFEASSAVVTVDLGREIRVKGAMQFPISTAGLAKAKQGLKALKMSRDLLVRFLDKGIGQLGENPRARELVAWLRQVQGKLKGVALVQSGSTLQANTSMAFQAEKMAPVLTEMLVKLRQSARRMQGSNNLKQLGIAMHNYADTYGTFPAHAVYSKTGKPLLSWRVLILPYIGQKKLYKQFKLDEPWNSPHNKKLLARMPKVYASPMEIGAKPHETVYQAFVGKGTIFEGKRGIGFAQILDGTSNTIMVVETKKAVPWTKPVDVSYDPTKPVPKLGGVFPGGFQALFADGSVRFISKTIKPKVLHLLIQRADGMPVSGF